MAKPMSIINSLASSLGRKDELPNQALAKEIVVANNQNAIKELVENLLHKNKNIQSDCIKVLYEVGDSKPQLIAPYLDVFVNLLSHKNNRLQWGAMMALNYISSVKPAAIYNHLSQILMATDKGSVITRDQAVNLLIQLTAIPKYSENTFLLLVEQLLKCPTNQLPMYAERAIPIINKKNKVLFAETLVSRLDEIEKESKRKRVEKVIKKFKPYFK